MTTVPAILVALPRRFFDKRKEIRVPGGADYDMFTYTACFELDSQTRFGDPFRDFQIIAHILVRALSHVLLGIDSGLNLQSRSISPIVMDNRLAG
jgi:hypothetical protein